MAKTIACFISPGTSGHRIGEFPLDRSIRVFSSSRTVPLSQWHSLSRGSWRSVTRFLTGSSAATARGLGHVWRPNSGGMDYEMRAFADLPTLETKRLLLRKMSLNDAEEMLATRR